MPDTELQRYAGRETAHEPGLPLPWVNYMGEFSPWLSFQEGPTTQPYFCSCMRPAIEGFLRANEVNRQYVLPPACDDLLYHFFGAHLAQRSAVELTAIKQLSTCEIFRERICHVCSGHVPLRLFPGAGILPGHFGWYVKLEAISDSGNTGQDQEKRELVARRRICERLGFPGHDTISREDLLHVLLRGAFPREELVRRVRPEWLDGLELDLFFPQRLLAIEYQGLQHTEPVEFFGGNRGYLLRFENDSRKLNLCDSRKVAIEYFTESDPFTEAHVRNRLAKYFVPVTAALEGDRPRVDLLPGGPDWEALPEANQLDTLIQIWLAETMAFYVSRGRSLRESASIVIERCKRWWGADSPRRLGVQPSSLNRKYYLYRKLGADRRWQDFCRYRSLLRPKARALHERGLVPEVVMAFFRARGGMADWARKHDVSYGQVRALFDPRRATAHADQRKIAGVLEKELNAYRGELLQAREKIRREIALLRKREERVLQSLRQIRADLIL